MQIATYRPHGLLGALALGASLMGLLLGSLMLGGCSPVLVAVVRAVESESGGGGSSGSSESGIDGELREGRPVEASTSGAADDYQPACAEPAGAGDRAYTFTPVSTRAYRLDLSGQYDTALALYSPDGTLLACNDDFEEVGRSRIDQVLTADQQYIVVVDGFGAAEGAFTLQVEPAPGGAGGGPEVHSGLQGTLVLDRPTPGNTSGRPDTATPPCGAQPGSPDQEWTFAAPEEGVYQFDVESEYDAVLALYEPNATEPLACNDDFRSTRASRVTAPLRPGVLYRLIVDGYSGVSGAYRITATRQGGGGGGGGQVAGPIAGALTVGQEVPGDNNGQPDRYTPPCGSTPGSPDQVWTFVAPTTGAYQIDTTSSFDSTLAVYQPGNAQPLECNDDFGSTRASRVVVNLSAGQTYHVVVDGYHGGTGNYRLRVSAPTSNAGNRGPIALDQRVQGSTQGAPDTRTPSCGSRPGSPDQTWLFTAPRTAVYRLHVDAQYDSVLAVYPRGAQDHTECNDDFQGTRMSQIVTTLQRGQTYEVVVDGFGSAAGSYALLISQESGATPTVVTPTGPARPENITAVEARCPQAAELRPGLSAGEIDPNVANARLSCGAGGRGGEVIYRIQVQQPRDLRVRETSIFNAVLELRDACSIGHNVLACNDDAPDTQHAEIQARLEPGRTYYLFVATLLPGEGGPFTLNVELTAPGAGGAGGAAPPDGPAQANP